MASILGVTTETYTEPADDQSWLVNRITDGTQGVTLDVNTFLTEGKSDQYFNHLSDDDLVGYIKSGIPLAIITSGDSQGLYGPYDPDATDGRNGPIEGLLESQFPIEFNRAGVKNRYVSAGMRYMAVINKANLPYPVDGASWHGMFYDNPMLKDGSGNGQAITALSTAGETAPTGPTTVTSAAISDATNIGKSVLTATDGTAARAAIGAGTSSFDGSYNSLKDKPTIPAAYTLPPAGTAIGGVKQVTLAADADPAAIVTALKASGLAK